MKILHYSDKPDSKFLELYSECNVLVVTGDLSLYDFYGLQDLPIKKPSFGVYGNHDSGNYMTQLEITNLHNRIIEHLGLKWGGFQGCLQYKNGGITFTEEEARMWADTFPYVDILLLHAGPAGMLDDPSDQVHAGSESVRSYVDLQKPKLIFVGHQYSNADIKVGNTRIYRTYGARIIEI